jgi:murein DD-endopeptidase MepM/ murein hydrolase activator NlpD
MRKAMSRTGKTLAADSKAIVKGINVVIKEISTFLRRSDRKIQKQAQAHFRRIGRNAVRDFNRAARDLKKFNLTHRWSRVSRQFKAARLATAWARLARFERRFTWPLEGNLRLAPACTFVLVAAITLSIKSSSGYSQYDLPPDFTTASAQTSGTSADSSKDVTVASLEDGVANSAPDNAPGNTHSVRDESLVDVRPASLHPSDKPAAAAAVSAPGHQVVRVKKGDTLMDVLVKAGISPTEADQAIASLSDVYDPRKLHAGQDVTLVFAPSGGDGAAKAAGTSKDSREFLAVRIEPQIGSEVVAKREVATANFSASQVHKDVSPAMARSAGVIQSSLFEAAANAGLPSKILAEVIHAFSYDVDFQRDIQPGDTFEVMYERLVDTDGRTVDTGRVVYASMTLSGQHLALYHYTTADGETDYYNQKGESVRKALLRTPIDGARLSSGFGMRNHPILGYTRMHRGVDFAAPTGTPIYAAGSGVVLSAGRNHGYGNYIEIRHDPQFHTAYGHLSRFAAGIHPGVRVSQGEVIGYVGMTGMATGPHLHYEVIKNNDKVNPLSVKLPSGRKLQGHELVEFSTAMVKVNQMVAGLPVETKLAKNE